MPGTGNTLVNKVDGRLTVLTNALFSSSLISNVIDDVKAALSSLTDFLEEMALALMFGG